MVKIRITGRFESDFRCLSKERFDLQDKVNRTIKLFKNNPKDTRLRVHVLMRRMKGKWAMSVIDDETGDLRIVFELLGKDIVRLLAIGGHDKAYEKNK